MHERTCRHCGTDISHRAPQALSCEGCRKAGARRTAGRLSCIRCGQPVTERHPTARVCAGCFQASRPLTFAAERSCVVCATAYLPRATNQITCGRECHYLRHKFGERATAALAVSREPRPCPVCDKPFSPIRRTGTVCSKNCARIAWARANPMAIHSRRAKTKTKVLDRDWRRLVQRHDHRCAYCHARKPLTADHVVPLSRGGLHTIGNLLPACKSCNSRKHTRYLTEWRLAQRVAA